MALTCTLIGGSKCGLWNDLEPCFGTAGISFKASLNLGSTIPSISDTTF